MTIFEKILREEHPRTAAALDTLAILLQKQEAYEEANSLRQRALAIRQKTLGEEHPDTVISLNNLSVLLYNQNKFKEALPHLKQTLAIREKVLGKKHSLTEHTRQTLARTESVIFNAEG